MSSGRQLAVLWGLVAAVLLLASPLAATIAPLLPGCPLKATTGLPCPACGSGRATLALATGDLQQAFHWNPAAAAFAISFVLGGVGMGLAAVRGVEPPSLPNELPAGLRWAAVVLLLANWLWVWQVAGA